MRGSDEQTLCLQGTAAGDCHHCEIGVLGLRKGALDFRRAAARGQPALRVWALRRPCEAPSWKRWGLKRCRVGLLVASCEACWLMCFTRRRLPHAAARQGGGGGGSAGLRRVRLCLPPCEGRG